MEPKKLAAAVVVGAIGGLCAAYVWSTQLHSDSKPADKRQSAAARQEESGNDEPEAGGALWGVYDESEEEASFAAAIANWRGESDASEDALTATAALPQQPAHCDQEAAGSALVEAAETTVDAAEAEAAGPVTADETAAIVADDAATAAVVLADGAAVAAGRRSANSRVPTWMVKDGNCSHSSASVISRDELTSLFPELLDPQVESEYRQLPFQFILLSAFCDGTSRAHWKRSLAASLADFNISFEICDSTSQVIEKENYLPPVMTYLHERKYGRFFKRNDLQHVCDVFRTVIGVNTPEVLFRLADKGQLHELMNELDLSQYQPERYDIDIAEFPCIVKPRQASNAQGACVCHDVEGLRKATHQASTIGHRSQHSLADPYVILQLIDSTTDCNTDFIACKGKLVHCVTFTKQTNPKEGIFWRQSIPASFAQTDPIIYDILEQIVKHTNYDGFGNIDYMYVDGVPKLFDFNPRPSGTLLRFGAPVMAIWLKKYAGLFDR